MKKVTLTERQIWFIERAIELKDAVLPLHEDNMDAKTFRKENANSKSALEKEIESLRLKITK